RSSAFPRLQGATRRRPCPGPPGSEPALNRYVSAEGAVSVFHLSRSVYSDHGPASIIRRCWLIHPALSSPSRCPARRRFSPCSKRRSATQGCFQPEPRPNQVAGLASNTRPLPLQPHPLLLCRH